MEEFNDKPSRLIISFINLLYIPPLSRAIPIRTFRYAICGSFNMVAGWVLYDIVYRILSSYVNEAASVPPHIATVMVVFPVNFLIGFYLNRNVTFKKSPLLRRTQLFRYVISVSGALMLNYLFIRLFVEAWGLYPTLGQVFSTILVAVYSFMMQKYFTFRGCENL